MKGNSLVADIFVYGTLRHVPLLEVVLGKSREALDLTSAHLPDMSACDVIGEPFPTLEPASGQTAPGLLIRGLDGVDIDRLNFYEGKYNYGLIPRTVVRGDGTAQVAQVFFPPTGRWAVGNAWSLEGWAHKWGPLIVRSAVEVMDYFGQLSPSEVGQRLTGIRLRAAAWVAAQGRAADPDHELSHEDVVVHAHHRRYSNFFAAEEMDLQFRHFDGSLGPVLNRGAQVLGQAAVVLPYDPVLDAVLMVEQFRTPVFMGGDRAPWIWEPVSGLVDPGETAQEAAHREAMEEAGLTLLHLEEVAGLYSSTGANSEFVYLFVGLADFSTRQNGGGLADEGEDIRARIVGFDDLMVGIDKGRYRDMPLVTTALWLARHRDRLRQAESDRQKVTGALS
jgi:nudix-type nucleoside diphosphatase (YffH/AdpP family)